jgi:hypothetical protein
VVVSSIVSSENSHRFPLANGQEDSVGLDDPLFHIRKLRTEPLRLGDHQQSKHPDHHSDFSLRDFPISATNESSVIA